jgi:hypothetical protein
MFQRGVAAASGGQRIAAAGLLRQAVRLNPEHEQAWLWLSGVVDDRDDVAFCLRAVLRINPDNERARQGLAQIDSWSAPTASAPLTARDYLRRLPTTWNADASPHSTTAWWMTWRDTRIALRSLVVLLWLVPLILLAITGSLRAIVELRALPDFVTYRDLLVPTAMATSISVATSPTDSSGNVAAEAPSAEPEPTSEPLSIDLLPDDSGLEQYFREVTQQRDLLQLAVEEYRTATEQSSTVLARVVAARKLSDAVGQGYVALAAIEPPAEAAQAHQMYLDGLTQEGQALQDLLAFYSDYDATAANRAALRLQEAHARIANARAAWDAIAQQLSTSSDTATTDRAVSPLHESTRSPDQLPLSRPHQPGQ